MSHVGVSLLALLVVLPPRTITSAIEVELDIVAALTPVSSGALS